MSRTIWVGAVAYDPKVVTIWEGMRRYFHEEAHLPVEVVLFQSYEMQVAALLAAPTDPTPRIDIAWNTNLAYLQADSWSDHRCRPIAMRDTDLGWTTIIVAASGGPVSKLSDLKIARFRLAAETAAMPRFYRSTFWSAKAWLRDGTIARFASTAMLETRRYRRERGRGRSRGARRPRRCRRDRQSFLENGARRATGAGGRIDGNLDVAALQSLHVHVTSRS